MHNEYPHMLYLGGDIKAKWLIVADAQAEKAALADGFRRAGDAPKGEAKPVKKAK